MIREDIISFLDHNNGAATFSLLWERFGYGSKSTFTAFLKSRNYLIQYEYRGLYYINEDNRNERNPDEILPFDVL